MYVCMYVSTVSHVDMLYYLCFIFVSAFESEAISGLISCPLGDLVFVSKIKKFTNQELSPFRTLFDTVFETLFDTLFETLFDTLFDTLFGSQKV